MEEWRAFRFEHEGKDPWIRQANSKPKGDHNMEVMKTRVPPRSSVMVLLVIVALIASACTSGTEAEVVEETTAERVKIGFINLSDGMPFGAAVKEGIESAAAEYDVDLISCDSNFDAQKALECARSFASQGVQGILNFQLDTSAAPRICDAGPDVPTIAIDIPQPDCEVVFYGVPNYSAGFQTGEVLGEYALSEFDCDVDVVLAVNAPAAGQVVVDRENGIVSGIQASCPDVTVEQIATEGSTDDAMPKVRDALTRHGEADHILVISTNDEMAIGAIKAAESVGRSGDIYVGSQNGFNLSWPYLCGEMEFENFIASTAYFPERYGDAIVPSLLALIDGQDQPRTLQVETVALTADNIRSELPGVCKEG